MVQNTGNINISNFGGSVAVAEESDNFFAALIFLYIICMLYF